MNQSNQSTESGKVYAMVTNRIIELLEEGVVPWKQSWGTSGLPENLVTGKTYRGVNVWLLLSLNYKQNYFLTFKQVKALGGSVKKGERGQFVLFVEWAKNESLEGKEESKQPILKYYNVFNIAQCEGIPEEKIPAIAVPNNPIAECESIIANMPQCPALHFQDGGPFYNQDEDYVNMPLLTEFESSEDFYLTFFREIIYSTGHDSRLQRNIKISKGKVATEIYATEELTAELGACYLMSIAGVKNMPLKNSEAYISGWLEKLKNDNRLIVFASAQAQRAVEFVLNSSPLNLTKEKEGAVNE